MVKKCLICGYIIRETNLNVNKDGILHKNLKDKIESCPFCGVSAKYIVDDEDKVIVFNGDLDEETLKIIENAMKLEVFNGDFYKQAATMTDDKEIKNMLLALANIEYTHAHVHRKLGGFKELPKLAQLDYSRLKDDSMILQEAKKREEHAIRYYNKYYNSVCHDEIRNFFEALIGVEKEHIIIINS